MPKRNRMSFNVNGARVGNVDYFLNFISRLKPTTVLVMDDTNLLKRVIDVTPTSIPIYRSYSREEGSQWKNRTPESYVDEITAGGSLDRRFWIYVLNEPVARGVEEITKISNWLIRVGQLLEERGYHAILGNIGPATWESWDIDAGLWDNYLRYLSDCSQRGSHYAGWHEYTSFLLPYGVGKWNFESHILNRDAVQREYWPTKEDLPIAKVEWNGQMVYPPYWHLLRSTWLDIRSDALGIPRHKKVITECFWDRMVDIPEDYFRQLEATFGLPHDGYIGIRCANTLENVWKWYYPDMSLSQVMQMQLEWANDIYPDEYIGFDMFTWSFNTEWDYNYGCNYGWFEELHELMIDYNNSNTEEPTEPEEPEEPNGDDTLVKYDMLAFMQGDGRLYNLRYEWAGGGEQKVQTKNVSNSQTFFHSKYIDWEELWYDNEFIWRGTDTSPNSVEVYQISRNAGILQGGLYGHPWIPRYMSIGETYKISPWITFRKQHTGEAVPEKPAYQQIFYKKLVAIHKSITFKSGITLSNVMELHGFVDVNGKPAAQPFEKYFYGHKYGLVAWVGTALGESYISYEFDSQEPDNQMLQLSWFTPTPKVTTPTPDASKGPNPIGGVTIELGELTHYKAKATGSLTNVRSGPSTSYSIVWQLTSEYTDIYVSEANISHMADGDWLPFSTDQQTLRGWVRSDVVTLELVNPDPDPDPPVNSDPFTMDLVVPSSTYALEFTYGFSGLSNTTGSKNVVITIPESNETIQITPADGVDSDELKNMIKDIKIIS